MKKVIGLLIGLAILCGAAQAQTKLSLWYHGAGNSAERDTLLMIINDFNSSQNDYMVELQEFPQQAYNESIVAAALSDESGLFHAYITARVKTGPADARGVIGHAVSENLVKWQVLAPVTEPGEFGYMEVPQLVPIENRYYLLFTVGHRQYSSTRKARGVALETGTHYLVADHPLGPFRYLSDSFLSGDEQGSLYSAKLIQDPEGCWQFLAFRNIVKGIFIGELSDPIAVKVLPDSRLVLQG